MTDISTYSIRPRVFLIHPHHTMDDEMLGRYISRRIVPAFDMFPDINLTDADIERLLMSQEVAGLPMDMFDAVEQALNSLSEIVGVDWVAVPMPSRKELFVAQVDHYEHIRYQAHLHVKHYIRFKNAFTIPYDKLSDEILQAIKNQINLSELPFELHKLIQRNKPEEPEQYPETSIADEPDEDLSFLDKPAIDLEPTNALKHTITNTPQREPHPAIAVHKPVIDNKIITPEPLPTAQRKLDEVHRYKRLHSSIMELHDYLRTNMTAINEYHSSESDLAFKGSWHDGTEVTILAFNLTDKRENSAWLIKFLAKGGV